MSKKTEAAVVRAAMLRFEELQTGYAVSYAGIVAGNKPIYMTEKGAALIRACHAHAKATNPKGKR